MIRRANCRPLRLRAGLAIAAIAAIACSAAVWAPPASADGVPFSDPNAVGYLGFCDKSGHQVRSGSTGAAPFAWLTVSSAAAPSGYAANVGRGTLDAFQPIQNVDPGDWSGKQLTAASVYSNTAHPMAAGTGADPALVDFTGAFPPHWDGLVQLRMYFTAPDGLQHSTPYPAAVVRIDGNTWTQVGGGDVSCTAGRAISAETLDLPASAIAAQAARSTPGARPASSGSSHAAGSSSTRSGSNGATAGPSTTAAALDKKSSGSGGGTLAWVLVVVVVVAAAGGVGVVVLRRNRATRQQ
jgi:hypothetical protein